MLYGDYGRPNPGATIVDAVARGQVDVAPVWGPLAGYFAHRSPIGLRLTAEAGAPQWPMVYDIAVGMRSGAASLRVQVQAALEKEKPAIEALLRAYHVPQTTAASFAAEACQATRADAGGE